MGFENVASSSLCSFNFTLPAVLPHIIFRVTVITACKNKLQELPVDLFLNPNIKKIDVSNNQLHTLPLTSLSGREVIWKCSSLKHLKCSYNKITCVPRTISGAATLEKLILNNNLLEEFDVMKVSKCRLVSPYSFQTVNHIGRFGWFYHEFLMEKFSLR